MKPQIALSLGHQLSLTPQLQQAIRLLQLSSVELQTEIAQEIEKNPLLELKEELPSEEEAFSSDSLLWTTHATPTDNDYYLESLNSTSYSLHDHLLTQMQHLIPENKWLIAEILIDAINDDGFLTVSIDEIVSTLAPQYNITLQDVESVLQRLQQCDPPGVGSRTIEECLRLQLNQLPSSTPWHHQAQLIITHYLLLLGKHDYATLQRRLDLSKEELLEVIQLIQSLNPRPGTIIGDHVTKTILPDVNVFKYQGKWHVSLYSQQCPTLTINHYYASLLQQKNSSTDNQFLRQQWQEARWFIKSLQTRHDTLLDVSRAIVAHQTAFFEQGETAMKPLTLQAIAEELNIHESTVSRITTQRYLMSPQGTFELKYFFSGHINKGTNDCSSTAVKALIKKLIQHESAPKPLSDTKIMEKLSEQGVHVARRTVTKYREEMKILPSFERKQIS